MIIVQSLPVGEEQQQVGDHADERRRQQDQAHQTGTLPRTTHGIFFASYLSAACLFLLRIFPPLKVSEKWANEALTAVTLKVKHSDS